MRFDWSEGREQLKTVLRTERFLYPEIKEISLFAKVLYFCICKK